MNKPFIIAEVGSNWKRKGHLGIELALRHISDAAACGADAVKFQLFSHRELYGIDGPDDYALPREWIHALAAYAAEHKIEFMCSTFSADGVRFVDRFVKRHKIASSEMLDPFILEAAKLSRKPIIVSTGGASAQDVADIAAGLKLEDTLMECVAAYPAKPADYSLGVLPEWEHLYGVQVGLSDHTLTDCTALAAVGCGAIVFEKHFDSLLLETQSETNASPDSPVSISPIALSRYCAMIRAGHRAMGDRKTPKEIELPMQTKWRRRLKVTERVRGGQDRLVAGLNFGSFRSIKDDLKAASPRDIDKFEGRRATCDLNPQDGVWFEDVE